MQKTYQIGERTLTVDATPDGPGRYRAKLEGREVTVEVRARQLVVDGRVYPIAVARDRDRTWVQVGPETFLCETVRGKRPGAAGKGSKDPNVKSPMAGKVLKVFVAVGDAVTAGQKLISLEAMKMENELHAAVAGKVTSIPVQVGQPIQPGDLLIAIEPAPAS